MVWGLEIPVFLMLIPFAVTRVLLLDNPTLETAFAAQYAGFTAMFQAAAGMFARTEFKGHKKALDEALTRRLQPLAGMRGLGTVYCGQTEAALLKVAKT